jgi:hypothetical protein
VTKKKRKIKKVKKMTVVKGKGKGKGRGTVDKKKDKKKDKGGNVDKAEVKGKRKEMSELDRLEKLRKTEDSQMFQARRLEAVEKQKEAEMLLARAKKEQVLANVSVTTASRIQVEVSLEASNVEVPPRETDARVQLLGEHREAVGEVYKAKLTADREKLFSSGLVLSDASDVVPAKDSEVVEKASKILNKSRYGLRAHLEKNLGFERDQMSMGSSSGKRNVLNFYTYQGKKVCIA